MSVHPKFDAAVMAVASPSAPAAVIQNIIGNYDLLAEYGIVTPLRQAHFLSQSAHESGGYRFMSENLRYSSAARLVAVFPKYFPTEATAQPYVNNPEKLANHVYANRMGNGPEASGDGFRFHGRGLIQITGRTNYTKVGGLIGLSLVDHPELAEAPTDCMAIACGTWRFLGCSALPETATVEDYTRKINGGLNGLEDRKKLFAKAKAILV